MHKVRNDDKDKLNKLPVRPIISNIGTATHKTAQYLCRLLTPLGKSSYTVQNTKEFVDKIKKIKVPEGHIMISFDVVSLFTNVPLSKTIDIILRKIYDEKQIQTKIRRENMKELLLLCTKGVPFSFNGNLYKQIDGVMMGSPLGALFANIFMTGLENTIIPKLRDDMCNWTRYVDDTFAFVKPGKEKEIQETLNLYHHNIKFTYECEKTNTIPFLDVLVLRENDGNLHTSVYRKNTNTDIYMNWYSHTPKTWKVATLKCLIKRAFLISSTESALEVELTHLRKVFVNINQYPQKLIDEIISAEKQKHTDNQQKKEARNIEEKETITLNLPYAGNKGENVVTKMKKDITKVLKKEKKNISVRIIYQATKLGARFPVKDKTQPEHMHNVVYKAICPNKKCQSHYNGQTRCRLGKRIIQHNRTDKQSHLLKHANATRHRRVWLNDFKIIGKGYKSNFKRKISESLFIKENKPDLNVQKDAYKLSLFN